MFTGIVASQASISRVINAGSMLSIDVAFKEGFTKDLNRGASISIDGTCLTVTDILSKNTVRFDVVLQSLNVTTLGTIAAGDRVNVERAAKDGAEIGGHLLSGHIDFAAQLIAIVEDASNRMLRIAIPEIFRAYIFSKGYIAINGCSLTIASCSRAEGWLEVWLIPETRQVTTFEIKQVGDWLNVEIDRGTQVMVDTLREAVERSLGDLYPRLSALLSEKELNVEDLVVERLQLGASNQQSDAVLSTENPLDLEGPGFDR